MTRTIRLSFVLAAALFVLLPARAIHAIQAQAQEPAKETWEQYQGPDAETFLLKARVRGMKNIGVGVTLPRKADMELNGVSHNAVFKTINDKKDGVTQLAGGAEINFEDSWRLEIAAYQVDRIIGLKMVPATVERTINGETGSLQWWVTSKMTDGDRRKQKLEAPDDEAWVRVYLKMLLFDELIANVDRNLGNILITSDWDLRLVDHSRSFRQTNQLKDPARMTRFSRELVEGIKQLEYQDLKKKIGKYVTDVQIKRLLERRDQIVKLVNARVTALGEARTLY